jgi:FAD:protein FMN transferase
MKMTKSKTRIASLTGLLLLLLLYSCQDKKGAYVILDGEAQGTTYHISYESADSVIYQEEIDSIFDSFNKTASLYDSTSMICKVNRNEPVSLNSDFIQLLNLSNEVSEKSGGAFDITVGPLVNAWGFGLQRRDSITPHFIDSIRQFTGYRKIKLNGQRLEKEDPRIKIDFNAIAQGYAVDLAARFLESKGTTNYLIELGGEVLGKGKNSKGLAWKVGIDKPEENSNEFNRQVEAIINISDLAIATSGSYRKFYIKDGIKYSHTIDPVTGFPVSHNLMSVSVTAGDCATADAWATAFMVLGLEKSREMIKSHPEMDAYFIWADKTGAFHSEMTKGMEKLIDQKNE